MQLPFKKEQKKKEQAENLEQVTKEEDKEQAENLEQVTKEEDKEQAENLEQVTKEEDKEQAAGSSIRPLPAQRSPQTHCGWSAPPLTHPPPPSETRRTRCPRRQGSNPPSWTTSWEPRTTGTRTRASSSPSSTSSSVSSQCPPRRRCFPNRHPPALPLPPFPAASLDRSAHELVRENGTVRRSRSGHEWPLLYQAEFAGTSCSHFHFRLSVALGV